MADKKQINPKKPIPSSGYDRLRDNLTSNFADGFPVGDFPNPDNRANINRGTITTRKDDTVQDVSIGLQDHDEAIVYYFNNVIKPSVVTNGNRINVPIMYGAPERWKGVQKDGHFRDKEGKLQVPLIMFKRDSVEKRRDLGKKMDANSPQLYYTFQERYTKKNQYDNFSVLMNRKPVEEYHATVIPDYVNITYSCIIWTDYVAQMNKLIESINYASDSYWGDGERFKFNAMIDTYNNTTEVSQGDNRSVKTTFGLKISGYLVPDSLNRELAKQPPKRYSKAVISFGVETESQPYFKPKTREQVREATGIQNVQQAGIGVGYSTVMGLGQTVGGTPTTGSCNYLYDYSMEYIVGATDVNINGIHGRKLVQWTDKSGNNNHLLKDDYSGFLPGTRYGNGGLGNENKTPILGGHPITELNYPTSSGGFIFDFDSAGKSGLFSSPITNLTEYTFFMCLYLGSDVSASAAINSDPPKNILMGKENPLIAGRATFDTALCTGMAMIRYEANSSYAPQIKNGNQTIRIIGNSYNSWSPSNSAIIADLPLGMVQSPLSKHILSVSVSGSGAAKIRINGVQAFTTGSSILSGSTYDFETMGSRHYQFTMGVGGPVLGAAASTNGLDGVVFGSALTDCWMTDTDMYAMEQVMAKRNGLSI
tara:strand:- start:11854 stop:13803 length:1950 start_codon:yes stop_codon:yes gene_type:complete